MMSGKHYPIMTMTASERRLPAEWEIRSAILLSWPHADTDWAPILDRVTECYKDLVTALVSHGQHVIIVSPDIDSVKDALASLPLESITFHQVATNDTWTRDFGPICIDASGQWTVADFKFNGWGLKFAACHDNLVTRSICIDGVIGGVYENHLGFVLEGGSIESDGKGTLLTTTRCLMSPNRNGDLSRSQIEEKLEEALGVSRILWLDHGALEGDDTDSHIDTIARIAPDDTIIYVGCDDPADSHYAELQSMKNDLMQFRTQAGLPYNLVELPLPDAAYDSDGMRLPATYANYLVTPEAVFMPTYGNHMKDNLAAGILQAVFGKEVVGVNCLPLIEQHGSLHCATMQIPRQIVRTK